MMHAYAGCRPDPSSSSGVAVWVGVWAPHGVLQDLRFMNAAPVWLLFGQAGGDSLAPPAEVHSINLGV